MLVFIRKRLRAPVISVLLILLFAVSFAAVCFTATYILYVDSNKKQLVNEYTAIAVMKKGAFERITYLANGSSIGIDSEKISSVYVFIKKIDYVNLDNREYLRGVLNNVMPITSGTFDPLKYKKEADKPRSSAAFVVSCEAIDLWNTDYSDTSFFIKLNRAHYKLTFRIQDNLLLHPSYSPSDIIYSVHWAFAKDGEVPFQVGKQYIILGDYEDIPLISVFNPNPNEANKEYADGVPEIFVFHDNMPTELTLVTNYYTEKAYEYSFEAEINGIPDIVYSTTDENIATFCIPVTESVEATIENTPLLQSWLDSIEKNIAAGYVLTTDRLDSLLHFNMGSAWIAEGRDFTDAEIADGAPVCVIHKDLAVYNDIKVGDKISVDLFETVMSFTSGIVMDHFGLQETDRHRGSLEVEVVGIYTAPEVAEHDVNQLSANTIIIPTTTVPIAKLVPADDEERQRAEFEEYRNRINNPMLFTAIIPADRVEEFRTAAADAGVDDVLIITDQGFSVVSERLERITETARLLFWLSLILLPVSMLILAVLARRERHELGLLMSLGMTAGQTLRQCMLGWAVLLTVSALIGAAASAGLFDPLSRMAIEQNLKASDYNDSFSEGEEQDIGYEELSSRFVDYDYTILILLIAVSQAALMCAGILALSGSGMKRGVLSLIKSAE